MNPLYRKLNERFPERIAPTRQSFQTEPRALGQWIAQLPLGNAMAAARPLLAALHETNALKIDGYQRLAALEMLRGPIQQMIAQADRQVVGSSFPLPSAKYQLGLQSREFHGAMALGYTQAAYEICGPEGKVPFLKGKPVAMALGRAISHWSEQLLRGYLLYATPQATVWKAMHDLIRFAQGVQLGDKEYDDPLLGKASVTPELCYKQALLFAISNPYRLSQRDMLDAFDACRCWAQYAVLKPGGGGEFAIPLEEDKGPGYLPEERQAGAGALLSFGTEPVVAYLERELSIATSMNATLSFKLRNGNPVSLGQDLIRRAMYCWKPVFDRMHLRLGAGHELDTLIGLTALHYHLANKTDFESFVRDIRGPGISMSERDRSAAWTNGATAVDSARPSASRARVLDQGLGGYRLEWSSVSGAKAKIGELIGMAVVGENDDDDERDWMVGSIRWIRFDADGRVEAGIELLARQATPAAVRPADTNGVFKTPMRAIELAPLKRDESAVTIVAPSIGDKAYSRIEFSKPAEAFSDTPTKTRMQTDVDVLENTGAYLRLVPKEAGLAA